MFDEIRRRLDRLEAIQREMVRPGVVSVVNAEKGRVKVHFPDTEFITDELPVLVPSAHRIQVYALPDVGDQVLCVFLPPTMQVGFVLGALYSQEDRPPIFSDDKLYVRFGNDGTHFEYDRSSHTLQVSAPKISLKAVGAINLDALQVNINNRNVRPAPGTI